MSRITNKQVLDNLDEIKVKVIQNSTNIKWLERLIYGVYGVVILAILSNFIKMLGV